MDKRVTGLTTRVLHKSLLQFSIPATGFRLVISAAAAFLILAGCENIVDVDFLPENSSVPSSSETPPTPQVKDGMLYFETKIDFDAAANYLINNQDDDGLDGFELELSPFRSLRTEFDDIINQFQDSDNDSLGFDRIVEDPVFETLLNQEGMVQIADTIYQVTRDYVYSTHIDNALILGKASLNTGQEILPGNHAILSSTTPLVKYEIDRAADVLANLGKNMDAMGRGECYVVFAPPVVPKSTKYRYRIKGSIWINNWGIYRSVGTELESQKIKRKGLRRWRHHRVDEIEISGTFSSREGGSTRTHRRPVRWIKYNAEEIRKTLTRDDDHSLVEIEVSLTHRIDHVFDDNPHIILDGSCDGYRAWSAPEDD